MDETYNDIDGILLGFGKTNADVKKQTKHISKHLAYKVIWKYTDKKKVLPCFWRFYPVICRVPSKYYSI